MGCCLGTFQVDPLSSRHDIDIDVHPTPAAKPQPEKKHEPEPVKQEPVVPTHDEDHEKKKEA